MQNSCLLIPTRSQTNPEGIVIAGVADNALMRNEVLRWINSDRLRMKAAELNYGDRFFTSTRLVEALCGLINEIPVGLSLEKPKLIEKVTPDQIVVGSGATGLLDALFTVLCDPGDGILLSVPYYVSICASQRLREREYRFTLFFFSDT